VGTTPEVVSPDKLSPDASRPPAIRGGKYGNLTRKLLTAGRAKRLCTNTPTDGSLATYESRLDRSKTALLVAGGSGTMGNGESAEVYLPEFRLSLTGRTPKTRGGLVTPTTDRAEEPGHANRTGPQKFKAELTVPQGKNSERGRLERAAWRTEDDREGCRCSAKELSRQHRRVEDWRIRNGQ